MSLAESLSSMITPSVVSNASKYFGESPASTERGLGAAMSTVLAGTAHLASSDGGASLAELMRNNSVDSSALGNIGRVGGNGSSLLSSGQRVLNALFGSRTPGIASAIESFAGIQGSTANSMLAMAGPMVLGFLSRQQSTQGLTAAGLAGQLASERDSITRILPPGVGNALGYEAYRPTAASPSQAAPRVMGFASAATTTVPYGGERNRWLIPALAILAALLALAALYSMRNARRVPVTTARVISSVRLPNGNIVQLQPSSFNFNLATFLDRGSAAELPRTFVFDHLNFLTGSTQLTSQSTPTVAQLAAILNAYPHAVVALTGYTDSTGDAEANRKLSLDRATTVRDQLVNAGVDSSRITVQGYGQDHPIASNDSDEGRARNRRLELTVTSK